MCPHDLLAGQAYADPPLTCTLLTGPNGSTRLKLVGELDLITAAHARNALDRAQAGSRTLVCDLGDVSFVDLSGLRALLDATENATLTGRRLTIANCPPIVPRMLELLGLRTGLDIRGVRRGSTSIVVDGADRRVDR